MTKNTPIVRVKRLTPDSKIPKTSRKGDAAFDLCSIIDYQLEPSTGFAIPTGIALEIPNGYEGQVRPRSGLALHNGVTVLNTPGTIDSGYRGEIKVIMINHGKEAFTIGKGMRIAQLAIRTVPDVKLEEADVLEESERGAGGFGSTGI